MTDPIHNTCTESVEDQDTTPRHSTRLESVEGATPRHSTRLESVEGTTRRPGRLQPRQEWQQQQQELSGRQETPDRVFEELRDMFEEPLRRQSTPGQQDMPRRHRVSFREENSVTPATPVSPRRRTRLELVEDAPATPIHSTRIVC